MHEALGSIPSTQKKKKRKKEKKEHVIPLPLLHLMLH
jgi:hypothetical protein